ncbi:MAG: hypothetical protein ACK5PG_05985 [Lysobacterales bacterium]|jgi:hypothetical protein
MKRRHWTHALRYSRHLLRLELRSLPDYNSPAFSHRTMDEARQINIALCRIGADLLRERIKCGNEVECDRNLRWLRLREELQEAVADTARRRELARVRSLRSYQQADPLAKTLMALKVSFGGQSAQEAAA